MGCLLRSACLPPAFPGHPPNHSRGQAFHGDLTVGHTWRPHPPGSETSRSGRTSMAIKTIEDLFIHELSDIYSAEKQLTKALPKLARAASAPELKEAFESHLEETLGQVERIDQIVELLDIKLKRIKCAAMEGLVEEGKEVIEEVEEGPLRDAALIGGAQKVEHYEIASYGTISAIAKQLGYNDAIPLLQATLKEEKAADEKLTLLAESAGNQKAAQKSKTKAA